MGIYDEIEEVKQPPKKKKTKTSKKKAPKKKKKKAIKSKVVSKKREKKEVKAIKSKVMPKEKPSLSAEEFFASIKPVPVYEKHLVECRCFLPQFKTWEEPPNHQFVVFSEIDQSGRVIPSYAQCNNCGIIHRVLEVGQSETLKKEAMNTLPDIDDYKPNLPDWLIKILEKYECELHVWQEAEFIYRNKQWGKFVVLAKEREDDTIIGKMLIILSENLHKIDIFEQDNPSI